MKWSGEHEKLQLLGDIKASNIFSLNYHPADDESTTVEVPDGLQYGGFYGCWYDIPDQPRVIATGKGGTDAEPLGHRRLLGDDHQEDGLLH